MAQYSYEKLKDGYAALWAKMVIVKTGEATRQAQHVIAPSAKARYKAVEETTGVPWFVVGCLHQRESSGNFNTWLHNGDPMRRNGVPAQTVNVPAHRPPNPNVSWEAGAYDALVACEQLDLIKEWGPENVAYAAEKFNGWGYRSPNRNIPSPYLWGGTNIQKPGKFVRDGVYDPSVMDTQLGAMAVLKEIMLLDPDARFREVKAGPKIDPPPGGAIPPPSPRADDDESETKLGKKSLWGAILSWLGGNSGFFAAAVDKLDNPYILIAFGLVLIVTSVGLYLVLSGRINAAAIIKHLARDNSQDAK